MTRSRKVEGGPATAVQIVGSDVPLELGYPVSGTYIGDIQHVPKSLTTWNGTRAVAGDNQLVAAPGMGQRLVVTAFVIQNESVIALIMRLRSGVTANGWRCLGQNQGDGLAMSFAPGHEWKLHPNDPLNLELSNADTCAVSISYYTEPV